MKLAGPISRGLSNAEISNELGYEIHTIENYVSELRELLGVPDRPRLMLRLAR
jgi:DNA-binding NarL/FixJ family response regulator